MTTLAFSFNKTMSESKQPTLPASPSNAPTEGGGQARHKPLGERLIERGLINRMQLDVALKEQRRTSERLGRILVGLGFVSESDIASLIFEDSGTHLVSLRKTIPDPSLFVGLDETFLRKHLFVPVSKGDGYITVAMANPDDVYAADQIRKHFAIPLHVLGATREEILDSIRECLGTGGEKLKRTLDANPEDENAAIRIVDGVLNHALDQRATDIHFEPEEKLLRIRYRVDGVLLPGDNVSSKISPAVLTRVKLLAGLDISEHRLPQDGRFRFQTPSGPVDLRVSVIPTVHGENIVVRVLDHSGTAPRLETLGLSSEHIEILKGMANRPYGILFVTGPTGSGKSTTLFALLATIDAMERKICTVEDPVEYRMPLIRQCQVNADIGFNFAAALRSILRQDPDVILVGETRDTETAQIAVRSALTGHLVMSTLHTNSAVGAIPRLIDMGIDRFLVNSTLIGVLAQRLVRMLCPKCKEGYSPSPEERRWLGPDVPAGEITLYRPRGCAVCKSKGFRGRTGLFELFITDDETAQLVSRGASEREILAVAKAHGMRGMAEDGKLKVLQGVTSISEVLRVISETEDAVARG